MFVNSGEEYIREIAKQNFDHHHGQGILRAFWSKLTGQRYRLLDIQAVQQNVQIKTCSHIGLQVVPTELIVGSEGRSRDFDTAWRPLKAISKQRWTNIATARLKGVDMPAVDLIKVGNMYFVRDGHHRVSVAKYQGQLELEANVIAWHCPEMPDHAPAANHLRAAATNNKSISGMVRQFLTEVRYRLMTLVNKAEASPSIRLSMTKA